MLGWRRSRSTMAGHELRVKIILIFSSCGSATGVDSWVVRPVDDRRTITRSCLVHRVELLAELVVLCKLCGIYRTSSASKALLKMLPANLACGVELHAITSTAAEFFGGDGVANSGLGCSLAKLSQVSPTETFCQLRDERQWHVWCNWRLAEGGLEDAQTGRLVWQWDVNQLVKTTGSQKSFVEQLWAIRGTNEEDILLHTYAINFRE
mmetsp:Transcript_150964/g.277284  ORF Transcript_150964/g.277284 Transcript_150964/m.277284 type:complete len:208 (+) Transcript_150964:40-663(+)